MNLTVWSLALAAGVISVSLISQVLFAARREDFSLRGLVTDTLALWWALPVAGVLVLFTARAMPQFAGPGFTTGPGTEAGSEGAEEEQGDSPLIPDDSLIYAEGREQRLPEEQQSAYGTRVAADGELLPLWVTRARADQEAVLTTAEGLPLTAEQRNERDAADGFVVLSSRQFATVEEAEAEVADATRERIMTTISRQHGLPQTWTLPDSVLADAQIIPRRHIETISRESGNVTFNVYRVWWEVAFTPEAMEQLEPVWKDQIVTSRLWSLGGLAALLTLLAGAATSYLRLDTLTGGRYRQRLKFAAVLLVVAGGALGAVLLPVA
ncbi:MAG: hypothetical protein KDA79_11440 [Planctomycetaceae bacterium]|nr:hypothetical protein [Planctomycetaceae bacterium]